ncbi:MAG TPA: NUDIX domain-containing protein [Ferruginibacter sp.]|nr:NUDIX domain-containing protein [Ferruginibacter sp.]
MKKSAGILFYRLDNKRLEVFLVHPGGPFWKNKDNGTWSIPKGEFAENELPLDAAIREVKEETGISCSGTFIELNHIKQKGGKIIYAWALEKEIDPVEITSNTFEIEWPPRTGQFKSFPEVDKGDWFKIKEAKEKINSAQTGFIDELAQKLKLPLQE